MKKYILLLCLLFLSANVFADEIVIGLEKAPINRSDKNSIKRGAKIFATTCMSCHTLIYLRYNKFANDQGILYEKMPVNVKWPAGAIPPDLSLEADVRGVDWIYTYLHSFYSDLSRSTGFNNLLVPNTMMPDMVVGFQGLQVLADDVKLSQTLNHTYQWYDLLVLKTPGSMQPQQFDAMVADVVNFLAFSAQPYYEEQTHLGKWVIGFLVIFFILVYLLKKEYWKDVK